MKDFLSQVADINFVGIIVTIFFVVFITEALGRMRETRVKKAIIEEIRMSRNDAKDNIMALEQIVLNQWSNGGN